MASPGRRRSLSELRVMVWHLHTLNASGSFNFALFLRGLWQGLWNFDVHSSLKSRRHSMVEGPGGPVPKGRGRSFLVLSVSQADVKRCLVASVPRKGPAQRPCDPLELCSGFSLSCAAFLTSIQRRRPTPQKCDDGPFSRPAGSGGSEQAARCSSASGTTAAGFSVATLEREEWSKHPRTAAVLGSFTLIAVKLASIRYRDLAP